MVIVIDLEEEEAKKAAEATAAAATAKQAATTASPNSNGSGQPGGDENGKSGKKSQSVPAEPQDSKGKPRTAGGEGASVGVTESSPTQKSTVPDTKKKEDTVKDSKSKPPAGSIPPKGRDGKEGKDSKVETAKATPSADKDSAGGKSEPIGTPASSSKDKVADGSKTKTQPAKSSTDTDKQASKGNNANGSKGKQQQAKSLDAEKVSSKGNDANRSKGKPQPSPETDKAASKGNGTNTTKSTPQPSKAAGADKPGSKSKDTVESKTKGASSTNKPASKGKEANSQSQASNVATASKKDTAEKKGKEKSSAKAPNPVSPSKSSSKGQDKSSAKAPVHPISSPESSSKGEEKSSVKTPVNPVSPPELSSKGEEKSSAKAPNPVSPPESSSKEKVKSSTEAPDPTTPKESTEASNKVSPTQKTQKNELQSSQEMPSKLAAEGTPASKNPVTEDAKSEQKQQPLDTAGQKDTECAESKVETSKVTETKEAVAATTEAESAASENPQVKKKPKPTYSSFSSSLMAPTLTTWVKNVREKLSRRGQLDKILNSFQKCKTDEERVACLYNIEDVHEVLNVKETYKAKSEDEAKDLRIQGNLAFQKKDYDAALKLYSECIINAPSKGSTELALALGNRSAVMYHLHNYVLCLQDIRQAFKHSYPDHLQYKLYERRGKACYSLRLKEEAICAFNDSLNVLDKTQLDQKKVATLKSDLMKQLEKCNKIIPGGKIKNARDYNHNHIDIPVLQEGRSPHIPCMMKSLVMKSSDGQGRGLFATRDIEVGEVLIVEKPFASITLKDYNLTHCHHCCNKVYCPLPCDTCSGVVFCSEECLDTAMKSYHYAECKYHDLIQRSELGMAHLALRMVLKPGRKFLRDYQKKAEEKTSDPLLLGCNKDGVYDSDDYHSVYNLVNHAEDRSNPDLFRRALCAVFLVKCIEKSGFFTAAEGADDFDVDEEKVYVGGHILRHTQMLPCNAHEVSELLYKTYSVEMSEPVEIGSAIYSTLSLINHSCDPSVVRHSYGNECVVRAIRNIPKGGEILDNYGVLYPVTSKQMRQEKLQAQYYFSCNCHACACNWPMYNKIRKEDPVLKCKKCKIGRIRIPPDNHTTRAICSDCREVLDITPDLLHLSKSEQFYQGSMEKVLKGDEREVALPFLVDHLKLIDTLLFRPWKDYNDCQEAIKQCYASMGNCQVVDEPDEDEQELMMGERRNLRPT
ncbi:uncharacterized protein [Haliotis cracherodii]|uniref:uncharacterized protein n=1 Tax=Haliotis cracherodii TaxID=6455 RepID=UPI0039E73083